MPEACFHYTIEDVCLLPVCLSVYLCFYRRQVISTESDPTPHSFNSSCPLTSPRYIRELKVFGRAACPPPPPHQSGPSSNFFSWSKHAYIRGPIFCKNACFFFTKFTKIDIKIRYNKHHSFRKMTFSRFFWKKT